MILLLLIFILLVLIYIVRISNNNDIINKNMKTVEDKEYIQKIKKEQHLTKVSIVLTIASVLLLIAFIIADFTSIDYLIMDYFATDFITEDEFNKLLYFTPAMLMLVNLIYTQVNIGDILLKYFKTQEEELELTEAKEKLMSLLYKKKPTTEETKKSEN